jgi:hypothetical protein
VTNGQQHAIGMIESLPSAIDAPAGQHPPQRRSSTPVGWTWTGVGFFSSQADPVDWFQANPVGVDVDGSGGVVVVFFFSRAGPGVWASGV